MFGFQPPPDNDIYVTTELGARWRMKRAVFLSVLAKRANGEDIRYTALGAQPVEYVPVGRPHFKPSDWCQDELKQALDAMRAGLLPKLVHQP